ncbi:MULTISPECIES: hypothetical protein [unclassified Moorena]|uniref:hypothetical protein n=1 Tax=unclassified Moorena TaxID=2683338 RepID=UPI0013B75352|nr:MULTISPECIES: hypothetical protein [unclassified Moorena]NEP34168.1 hypothetical protein [Moorena sp. SIO3B2]NEQ07843.1 hypothetical protein [Moorena sp. SIO4E2]
MGGFYCDWRGEVVGRQLVGSGYQPDGMVRNLSKPLPTLHQILLFDPVVRYGPGCSKADYEAENEREPVLSRTLRNYIKLVGSGYQLDGKVRNLSEPLPTLHLFPIPDSLLPTPYSHIINVPNHGGH